MAVRSAWRIVLLWAGLCVLISSAAYVSALTAGICFVFYKAYVCATAVVIISMHPSGEPYDEIAVCPVSPGIVRQAICPGLKICAYRHYSAEKLPFWAIVLFLNK
jgi:hypothetical protein